jgi:hypothetical protein
MSIYYEADAGLTCKGAFRCLAMETTAGEVALASMDRPRVVLGILTAFAARAACLEALRMMLDDIFWMVESKSPSSAL